VQYLFKLSNTSRPGSLSPQQQNLASTMQQYWTNLATLGSPSSPNAPVWPRFDDTQRMLSLVVPTPIVETDFGAEHECNFWADTAALG
jgi:para-nitrobenzyl esterase